MTTKKERGPHSPVHMTFEGMFGYYNQGVSAGAPATQLWQDRRSIMEVIVQCDPNQQTSLLVGGAAGQWIVLRPGESITIPIHDISAVFVSGLGGASVVNWLAME